jgi:hypothetical protein
LSLHLFRFSASPIKPRIAVLIQSSQLFQLPLFPKQKIHPYSHTTTTQSRAQHFSGGRRVFMLWAMRIFFKHWEHRCCGLEAQIRPAGPLITITRGNLTAKFTPDLFSFTKVINSPRRRRRRKHCDQIMCFCSNQRLIFCERKVGGIERAPRETREKSVFQMKKQTGLIFAIPGAHEWLYFGPGTKGEGRGRSREKVCET